MTETPTAYSLPVCATNSIREANFTTTVTTTSAVLSPVVSPPRASSFGHVVGPTYVENIQMMRGEIANGGAGINENDTYECRRSVVREINDILPDFNPCKEDMTSMQFVERVEQLKDAYRWNDSVLLFAIQSKFKGVAKLWVDSQPIFKQCADIHIQLMHTRMNKTESLTEFYFKMLALGRRGNLEDNAIMRYIINGLSDDGLRKTLTAMHFVKCSDLLKALNNTVLNMRKDHVTSASTFILRNNNSGSKIDVKTNMKNGPVCYNCGERGHISRNCLEPRKKLQCGNCAEFTHETKKCPKRNQSRVNAIVDNMQVDQSVTNNEAIVNAIEDSMQVNRTLTKTILINHVECEALIDSGSCKSLVKRDIVEKSEHKTVLCDKRLHGFAGVVDYELMAYDAIIGTDILSKSRVVIENGQCYVGLIDENKINVGHELAINQQVELKRILNKYANCFGEELREIGKCSFSKMQISLTSEKPVVRNPYPIPIPKQKIVEEIVTELMNLNIIRPSNSMYASPIVLVPKANGEHRLCVDYREVNAITQKQPWPMPTVDGTLSILAGKKYFTTLDMMSGYYQIEIEEE
ncbi:uncharacterized protein LOC118733478 [Rhagoletis pomonella]|uniref:uncharacterized protein LOC118733478 n=1 Tax=Rhagoletis pomonella TaxID=28610 RepID=UPI0017855224|nr:uncharacterized protein LOC118733478 [Rhagoletis pomonella]